MQWVCLCSSHLFRCSGDIIMSFFNICFFVQDVSEAVCSDGGNSGERESPRSFFQEVPTVQLGEPDQRRYRQSYLSSFTCPTRLTPLSAALSHRQRPHSDLCHHAAEHGPARKREWTRAVGRLVVTFNSVPASFLLFRVSCCFLVGVTYRKY